MTASQKVCSADERAFTLLEVMIAIAIIAITFTSLLGLQSNGLSLATEAKFNNTAALLAKEKLAGYEAGLLDYVNDSGDFGEQFPGYRWRSEVRDAVIDNIELLSELDKPLQRIDVTVSLNEDEYEFTMTCYTKEKVLL